MAGPSSSSDVLFASFYTEVKDIEQRDSVLTSDQQIRRLLKPGASYLNLNPYEVLQVDTEASEEDIKRQFKKLSILVHPDRNPDDKERADEAFQIINNAYKTLNNAEAVSKIKEIILEGKARAEAIMREKRRKAKKDGQESEDDAEAFNKLLYVTTIKVFAEKARKRKELEERDAEERKRKRELEIEAEEKQKMEREFIKNYEETRDNRMASWKDFQGKSKKSKTSHSFGGFKPPKLKPEKR